MKVVITGGAGFIGSHIQDEYIKLGHKIVVVDNFSTGSKDNLNPKAKFYKADIRDLSVIEKIFKKEKPDIVSHQAALVEVARSLRDPIPTLEVNVLGTANVLQAFGKSLDPSQITPSDSPLYLRGREKEGPKFIFASTGGAIYGEPKKLPATEKTEELPLSPYGLSKFQAEQAVKMYANMYGFDYFIFRYSNVYGPRQNPHGEAGVVAIFSQLMKQGKRPKIFGDGSKTRDYVYVGDIVKANVLALKKGKNDTVNLGTGKQITDQQVFDEVAKNSDFAKKPIYKPFRHGEVNHISLDPRKARKVLGWKPEVQFDEGVRKTVNNE